MFMLFNEKPRNLLIEREKIKKHGMGSIHFIHTKLGLKDPKMSPCYTKNKSNTECGIIRPTNTFTRDHIHYLEVAINNIL